MAAEARRIGYRLDPHAVTRRAGRAASERRVTLRPAPDTMALLTALLPGQQAVAAYAALTKAVESARATGVDVRGRGQLMADTLVERITGQRTAEAVPAEVQVVMTDRSLLEGGDEPAELDGIGPIPGPVVRSWLAGDGPEPRRQARAWLRRLYTSPESGQLVAMDSRRRCFDGQLRRFVITADRTCRTPWCDAPIRHLDHVQPAADGGEPAPTTVLGCAKRATTPVKSRAGSLSRCQSGLSRLLPRPATATEAGRRLRSARPAIGLPPNRIRIPDLS